ncbi:MAG: AtpZ/AtpI family protein [Acidimicrobiia bacterium]
MSKYHEEIGRQVAAGVDSASFFATIMSGFALGALTDWWLGTKPVFIVIGIIAGSIIGFWRMWTIAGRDSDD